VNRSIETLCGFGVQANTPRAFLRSRDAYC
jgi:hypothetical protein